VVQARMYISISAGTPPDASNCDASNHDRANSVKVYLTDDGGTTWFVQRYDTVSCTSPGPYTSTVATLQGGTTGIPNSGTAFPAAVLPGKLVSAATRQYDTTLPLTYLDGAGVARIDGVVPVGTISLYAAVTPPTGWLSCNGQAVSRTVYQDLFQACGLGAKFGAGDGSTTFNLPDLRGRMPVGVGGTGGVGPNAIGDAEATSASSTAPGAASNTRMEHRHVHTTNGTGAGHTHNIAGQAADSPLGVGTGAATVVRDSAYVGHAHGGDTGSTGSSHTHGMDSQGLAGANTPYHGMLALTFMIRA